MQVRIVFILSIAPLGSCSSSEDEEEDDEEEDEDDEEDEEDAKDDDEEATGLYPLVGESESESVLELLFFSSSKIPLADILPVTTTTFFVKR